MEIFKFSNNKKNIILLVLLSLVALLPILTGGMFLSHDTVTHAARSAMYANAISDGQFLPRWAEYANYGFGSPFFIFYYPLTGYTTALLYLAGMSIESSLLLISAICFVIGPVFFYLWIRKLFKSEEIAFFSSVFFLALPNRFLTLHVRGGIGELLGLSLLPLIFYCIEKFEDKKHAQTIFFLSISYALLVLSHNGVSLMFTPIILLYSAFRKGFIRTSISLALGLLLSAFFWVPAFFEAKYTAGLHYFGDMYAEHFAPIISFIYSPWGFGPDVNKTGGLSPQIGIFGFLTVGLILYLLFKKKLQNEKRVVVFWIFCFAFGLFMATSYSDILWRNLDFLKKFQFPWRFISVPSFAVAALSPYILLKIKNKKIVIGLITMLLLFSLQFVRVSKNINYPDSYYFAYEGSTYFHNEGTTIWSAGDPSERKQFQIELIGGEAEISNILKKGILHSFEINAKTPSIILDNTIYFPGWEAYIDEKKTVIEYQDPNNRGLITFTVPEGKHQVVVKFGETKLRLLADTLSVIGIVTFAVFGFYLWRRKNK